MQDSVQYSRAVVGVDSYPLIHSPSNGGIYGNDIIVISLVSLYFCALTSFLWRCGAE